MEREILPGQPRPPRPSKCNGDFTVAVPWLSCAFCQCCQIFFALELNVSAEITWQWQNFIFLFSKILICLLISTKCKLQTKQRNKL